MNNRSLLLIIFLLTGAAIIGFKSLIALPSANAGRTALGNTLYRHFPLGRGSVFLLGTVSLAVSFGCWKIIKSDRIKKQKLLEDERIALEQAAKVEQKREGNLRMVGENDLLTIPARGENFTPILKDLDFRLKQAVTAFSRECKLKGFDDVRLAMDQSLEGRSTAEWKCYFHFSKNKFFSQQVILAFSKTKKGISCKQKILCGMKENGDIARYPIQVMDVDPYNDSQHALATSQSSSFSNDNCSTTFSTSDKYINESFGETQKDYEIWRAKHKEAASHLDHLASIIKEIVEEDSQRSEDLGKFANA